MAANPLSNSQGIPPAGYLPQSTPTTPGGLFVQAVALTDSNGDQLAGTPGTPAGSSLPVNQQSVIGVSLSAQSVLNTNGAVIDLGHVVNNPVQVTVASAGCTAGQVALQGSLDQVTWYTISAGTAIVAAGSQVNTAATPNSIPARYLRSTITTGIVGGTVTTTLSGAGS